MWFEGALKRHFILLDSFCVRILSCAFLLLSIIVILIAVSLECVKLELVGVLGVMLFLLHNGIFLSVLSLDRVLCYQNLRSRIVSFQCS